MKDIVGKLLRWWCQLVIVVMTFCLGSAGMIWSFKTMETVVLSL